MKLLLASIAATVVSTSLLAPAAAAQNQYVFGASGSIFAQLQLAGSTLGTLTAVSEGSLGGDGVNYGDNYIAGVCSCGGPVRRSYFEFSMPAFTGSVTSAVLHLSNNRYNSFNATELFSLFALSTDITAELQKGTAVRSLFDLLGTGSPFGSVVVSDASTGGFVDVLMNQTFLNALNAHPTQLNIAGRLTSADPLVTPEPGVFSLLLGGLLVTTLALAVRARI